MSVATLPVQYLYMLDRFFGGNMIQLYCWHSRIVKRLIFFRKSCIYLGRCVVRNLSVPRSII